MQDFLLLVCVLSFLDAMQHHHLRECERERGCGREREIEGSESVYVCVSVCESVCV